MRASVRAQVVPFTTRFEGKVPFLYLDFHHDAQKRLDPLVTIAIGNLVDPIELALDLPLLHGDGTPASPVEIAAEWHNVKRHVELAARGGLAFRAVTTLHLDDEGIASVVAGRFASNEAWLRRRFPEYEDWPADGQLGILSMAWAAGAAFHFPRFEAAAAARDFATCSVECHMADALNPGLVPRNKANAVLFMNAAAVQATGGDPEELHFPTQLPIFTEAPPSTKPEVA